MGLDLEELDPVGPCQPGEYGVDVLARDCPAASPTPRRASSSTRSGRFQSRNCANSSAPTRNTGSGERERFERIDRSRIRIERDLGAGDPANASRASSRRTAAGVAHVLVAGPLDHADEQSLEPEVRDAAPRERDVTGVRRVERASETAPTPIRAPRRRSRPRRPAAPPLRAARPRAPRPLRGVSDDAKAPVGAAGHGNRGLRGRGRYSRNSGSSPPRPPLGGDGTQLEERVLELADALAGDTRDVKDSDDALSSMRERRRRRA